MVVRVACSRQTLFPASRLLIMNDIEEGRIGEGSTQVGFFLWPELYLVYYVTASLWTCARELRVSLELYTEEILLRMVLLGIEFQKIFGWKYSRNWNWEYKARKKNEEEERDSSELRSPKGEEVYNLGEKKITENEKRWRKTIEGGNAFPRIKLEIMRYKKQEGQKNSSKKGEKV